MSSYTTVIFSITACLVHAPKKCTQSGNFQFDIKSPSDFKILSARKLKTVFHKYKLELTTGIHACIGHVLPNIREFLKDTTTADNHEIVAWKKEFTFFQFLCNSLTLSNAIMQANSSGAEFLSTISKYMKRMNFVITCLHPSQTMKLGIFTGSRAVEDKEMYKKV